MSVIPVSIKTIQGFEVCEATLRLAVGTFDRHSLQEGSLHSNRVHSDLEQYILAAALDFSARQTCLLGSQSSERRCRRTCSSKGFHHPYLTPYSHLRNCDSVSMLYPFSPVHDSHVCGIVNCSLELTNASTTSMKVHTMDEAYEEVCSSSISVDN